MNGKYFWLFMSNVRVILAIQPCYHFKARIVQCEGNNIMLWNKSLDKNGRSALSVGF